MLILTRKRNQTIQIGNTVVFVKQIRGNQVTLGIEAPREVRVLRGELESTLTQPCLPKQLAQGLKVRSS